MIYSFWSGLIVGQSHSFSLSPLSLGVCVCVSARACGCVGVCVHAHVCIFVCGSQNQWHVSSSIVLQHFFWDSLLLWPGAYWLTWIDWPVFPRDPWPEIPVMYCCPQLLHGCGNLNLALQACVANTWPTKPSSKPPKALLPRKLKFQPCRAKPYLKNPKRLAPSQSAHALVLEPSVIACCSDNTEKLSQAPRSMIPTWM